MRFMIMIIKPALVPVGVSVVEKKKEAIIDSDKLLNFFCGSQILSKMILLDVNNKAVYEALAMRFENATKGLKPETTELVIAGNEDSLGHGYRGQGAAND